MFSGGMRMKRSGMDERLDAILVRAAMRLEERMRLAYFRGNLSRYLERVGLAQYIDEEKLIKGSLLDLQDDAALAMAYVLRKARNNGYLKEALDKLNMAELLQNDALSFPHFITLKFFSNFFFSSSVNAEHLFSPLTICRRTFFTLG